MNARLILDEAGRIAIPKPVRDRLHLEPGDTLEVETSGDRITLRPVKPAAALVREQGVWVLRTGEPLAASVTDEVLERIREARDLSNLCPEE